MVTVIRFLTKWEILSHLIALDAPSGVFLFVTLGAVDFLLFGDETLGSNWYLAHYAAEALLMPLSRLVFHFLRAYSK